jgi:D-alanine-D-alanine ligase
MPHPEKVVIIYRPFSNITDEAVLATLATNETVEKVRRALIDYGYTAEVLYIDENAETALQAYDPRRTLIFNYCEGLADGTDGYDPITKLLDEMGFVYTGATDRVIVLSFDKGHIKATLRKHRIPTPEYRLCDTMPEDWTLYPALVKPAGQHGSYGITRTAVVDNPEQLAKQIEYVVQTWNCPALIEDFIDGTEYRVSLWGNGMIEMLPLMEIDFSPQPDYHRRLKDFETKWAEEETVAWRIRVPAPVPRDLEQQIFQVATDSFRALELQDYGSLDVRVRDGQVYVIDVNANCDLADNSNFRRAINAAGMTYSQMIGRIASIAAQRLPG